jgi:hypothetical protein
MTRVVNTKQHNEKEGKGRITAFSFLIFSWGNVNVF